MIVVGRSRDCDLRVDDPAASRRHFQVERRQDSLHVRDLGSSNGTYRNGRRLREEERLEDGDVLLVGETELTVRTRGTEHEAPDGRTHATVRIPTLSGANPVGSETPPRGTPVPGEGAPTPPAPPPPESRPPARTEVAEHPLEETAIPPPPPPIRESDPGADLLPAIDDVELGDRSSPPPPPPSETQADRSRSGSRPSFLPPAGFWVRLAAALVDAILISLVSFLVALPFGGSAELVVLFLMSWLLSVGVPVVGWARWGTTPGKRLFGLVICTTDGDVGIGWGQAAIRWVGYLLSGLLLGAGFLMIGFTASKRGLHDHLAGTYVGKT